jgi:hypothetical protein
VLPPRLPSGDNGFAWLLPERRPRHPKTGNPPVALAVDDQGEDKAIGHCAAKLLHEAERKAGPVWTLGVEEAKCRIEPDGL